jgi:transcriptional repressor NrdR
MKCPFCGSDDTQVKDSRPTDDNTAIRRRRSCTACGARFTTFERVQLREMTVVKAGGQREPLDRDKLARSMSIALRKRAVDPERVERAITGIIRRIESSGQTEVASQQVGELVMDALRQLDQVAYIRYASVYRNFREARDFEDFVESLNVSGEEEVE